LPRLPIGLLGNAPQFGRDRRGSAWRLCGDFCIAHHMAIFSSII
jgi:hypothetical protein